MQASNYTQELKDRGLTAPARLLKIYDVNPMGGGRIIKDRLWFYLTARVWGADRRSRACLPTRTPAIRRSGRYEPDLNQPAFNDEINRTNRNRAPDVAGDAAQQADVLLVRAVQLRTVSRGAVVGGWQHPDRDAESIGIFEFSPSRVQQATYSSPVSNRFLVEAGFGTYLNRVGQRLQGPHRHARERSTTATTPSWSGRRTGRQYPGPDVPGPGQLQPQQHRDEELAGVRFICHRARTTPSSATTARGCRPEPQHHVLPAGPIFQYRFNNGVPNQLSIRARSERAVASQTNVWPTASTRRISGPAAS